MHNNSVLEWKDVHLERIVDGTLRLGQPEEFGISAIRGGADYGRDEGKYVLRLKIKDLETSFSIILDGGQIKKLTSTIWHEYLSEEKSKAIQDLKDIFPIA